MLDNIFSAFVYWNKAGSSSSKLKISGKKNQLSMQETGLLICRKLGCMAPCL